MFSKNPTMKLRSIKEISPNYYLVILSRMYFTRFGWVKLSNDGYYLLTRPHGWHLGVPSQLIFFWAPVKIGHLYLCFVWFWSLGSFFPEIPWFFTKWAKHETVQEGMVRPVRCGTPLTHLSGDPQPISPRRWCRPKRPTVPVISKPPWTMKCWV